jgi:GT2 family glycosyltransferase
MDDIVTEWMHPAVDGVTASSELTEGISVGICTYKRPASISHLMLSMFDQSRPPDQCVVVDASPDDETEKALRLLISKGYPGFQIVYRRVRGSLKGLTRQRNAVLKLANRHVIVFFDDDVILDPECLDEMEKGLRDKPNVAGVGACNRNELSEPALRWRLLRLLGGVPDLVPGRYHRCGLSIPLSMVPTHEETVEVDRLCGNAMAWRTEMARVLEFADHFHGYAQSEDVEFSRRAARHGRLLICNRAKVDHFPDKSGRPDLTQLARMGVLNRFYVHRTTLNERTFWDVVRFAYGNYCYEMILGLSHLREDGIRSAVRYWWGAVLGGVDIVRGRFEREGFGGHQLTPAKICTESALKE